MLLSLRAPFALMQDQQAVLDGYQGGRRAVLAAPGAGKTTLISRLIADWIQRQVLPARQILVLTFTESAAREFEQRTRLLLEPFAELPVFSTIHGFCNRLLRQLHSHYSDRQVASEERRYALLAEVLDGYRLWHPDLDYARVTADALIPAYRLAPYVRVPANAEDLALLTGQPSEHAELLLRLPELVEAYERRLAADQLIDYDMMISETVRLLEQNPRMILHLQARYRLLLEDEAQDSNPLQARLLDLIAGSEGNLLRVGDPNQSIYGFSGADYRSLKAFAEANASFPMGQSNRSALQIMDYANAFHRAESAAFPSAVELAPGVSNPPDGWIWVKAYPHVQAELADVMQACRSLLDTGQTVAVLCRTNLACQWLHQQLQGARLPSVLHHDRVDHFFQSDIVQRVRHALDYLLQPDQYHLLQQLLIELGVSRQTLRLLLDPKRPVDELLSDLAAGLLFHPAVPTAEYQALMQHAASLRFLVAHLHYPVSQLLEWLAERLIADVETRAQLRLLHALWLQTHIVPVQGVDVFRAWLDQAGTRKIRQALIPGAAQDSLTAPGVIHILTAHKAKGLEWDGVMMPLFQFGSRFSGPDRELRTQLRALQRGEPFQALAGQLAREEELETIRLVYVGMTRARRYLSLTASQEACRAAGVYQAEITPLFGTLQRLYKESRVAREAAQPAEAG